MALMPTFKRVFRILWDLLTCYCKTGRWKGPRMLQEEGPGVVELGQSSALFQGGWGHLIREAKGQSGDVLFLHVLDRREGADVDESPYWV